MPSTPVSRLLEYEQLKMFVTVCRETSITKAAKELFVSQQALSKSIQQLEDELGTKLFQRTPHGTELTEVGKRLYPVAQSTLHQIEFYAEIVNEIIENDKNSVTIAYEHRFLPYAIPAELTGKESSMFIRSIIADGIEPCVDAVADGLAAIGFCMRPDDSKGLSFKTVVREPLQFLMNEHNRLARKASLKLEDMRDMDHVLPLGNIEIQNRYISECLKAGFYPNFVFEASDLDLLVRNVQVNNVVQLTASFVLTDYSSENLVLRSLINDNLIADYGFIYDESRLTRVEKSFMNAVLSFYNQSQFF